MRATLSALSARDVADAEAANASALVEEATPSS